MNALMTQFRHVVSRRRVIAVLVWVVAALPSAGRLHAQAPRATDSAATVSSETMDFFPPRVERDAVRDRIWAINGGAVMLYDGRTRTLVKKIELPDWTYVIDKYSCAPDLAVDWAGNVLVSSNVIPALWRIDAETLAVSRIDIVLDYDNEKDVGFTGLLSVSANDLFAISAIHGSLWRIDLRTRSGAKLDLAIPIKGACALGFANHTDVGPYRIYEGAAPRLLLCASTRNGLRQVEMTGLAQATRMEAPCPQK